MDSAISLLSNFSSRLIILIIFSPYYLPHFLYRLFYHGGCIVFFKAKGNTNPDPPVSEVTVQAPLDPYIHTPLKNDRHIRLLKLKHGRSNNSKHNILEGELHEISLDEPLLPYSYRAISYAWEGQTPDRFLICNGKQLPITRNCEAVLRQVNRYAPLCIWIDAICIDQANTIEKSSQIPLMTQIYKRAYVVNIWLGELKEGTELVYHYIWLFWCCLGFPERIRRWLISHIHRTTLGKPNLTEMSRYQLTTVARGHTPYVIEFLRRPWWRRVWTIQESILSPELSWIRPIAVYTNFGDFQVPLYTINSYLLDFCVFHELTVGNKWVLNNNMAIINLRSHYPDVELLRDDTGTVLRNLMLSGRACGTADPRDRVYAMYGVLGELGLQLPLPDYNKTKEDVYWQFTITACEATQSLKLLELISFVDSAQTVPSWVPDYSDIIRPHDTVGRLRSATCNSSAIFEVSNDGRVLFAEGMIIDRIEAKSTLTPWHPAVDPTTIRDSPIMNLEEGYIQTLQAFRDWERVLLDHGLINRYNDHEGLLEAFGQALTGGLLPLIEKLNLSPKSIYTWLCFLTDDPKDWQGTLRNHTQYSDLIEKHFYRDEERRSLTENEDWQRLWAMKTSYITAYLHHVIWMLAKDRCFFVTTTGFVGTAHHSIEEGDFIVLLAGVDKPLVLRDIEGYSTEWMLVGAAYLEGVMDGEMWDISKLSRFEIH